MNLEYQFVTRSAKLIIVGIRSLILKSMTYDLAFSQMLGAKVDKSFALLISSGGFLILYYNHLNLGGAVVIIIGTLFTYSTRAIYRSDRSTIAKISRSMTGLIIISISGIHFSKQIFRWSLGPQILIAIAFSIVIYNTQRVFVSRIRLSHLMLAAVLDLIIVFFILNR